MNFIVPIIVTIIIAITGIVIAYMLLKSIEKTHQEHETAIQKRMAELESLAVRIESFQIDYSKSYLEYVKYIVAQTAVIDFRNFQDSHDVTKATKAQITQVVDGVARKVKDTMQFEKIDFNHVKFTQRYLEDIIVNTTVINIKKLLEDAIEHYDET